MSDMKKSKLEALFSQARSGQPDLLPEYSVPTPLFSSLTNQPWESIGMLGGSIMGTEDFEATVEQLSSILECRLADVIVERKMEAAKSQKRVPAAARKAHDSVGKNGRTSISSSDVVLLPSCRAEIREYVRLIGHAYRGCSYHRFSHAAHVTFSANKLLDCLDERDLNEVEPTVPPVYFDHPELDEFVRRMSDLRRRSVSRRSSNSGKEYRRPSTSTTDATTTESIFGGTQGTFNELKNDFQLDCQHAQPQQSMVSFPAYTTQTERDPSPKSQVEPEVESEAPYRPRSSTYGISSDSMTKFSLVYATLIHDVDHQGIPNKQLVAECDELTLLYHDKSIAEQQSLEVGFSTLMKPEFSELRHCLIPTPSDQLKFRRIVIDLVLCTDIASPERMQLNKSKWDEAFGSAKMPLISHSGGKNETSGIAIVTVACPHVMLGRRKSMPTMPLTRSRCNSNAGSGSRIMGIKRALHLNGSTIEFYATPGDASNSYATDERLRKSAVLEAIMKAADVAQTLQGWENFVKWNRRLYEELHCAYVTGRVQEDDRDPAKDWYVNQLFFYDVYVLPLSRKLRKCKAFGPIGREFVRNAKHIRKRWQEEGMEVSAEMIKDVHAAWQARLESDLKGITHEKRKQNIVR